MFGSQHYKKDTQRKRKLKLPYGESEKEHTEFNGRKSFITDNNYSAIDTLKGHLARRNYVYLQLRNSFGFLWNMNEVEKFDLKEKANNLLNMYPSDLDLTFPEECLYLQTFLQENKTYYEETKVLGGKKKLGSNGFRLLSHLKSLKIESLFPNVEVALRIYLSMAVTNYSEERYFSVLGRVKKISRSTLRQDEMKDLALLFIESEFMNNISFDEIAESFATLKSRKKLFLKV